MIKLQTPQMAVPMRTRGRLPNLSVANVAAMVKNNRTDWSIRLASKGLGYPAWTLVEAHLFFTNKLEEVGRVSQEENQSSSELRSKRQSRNDRSSAR